MVRPEPQSPPEREPGVRQPPGNRPPDQGLSPHRRAPSALMPPSGLQTEPHPLPARPGPPARLPTPQACEADTLPGGWAQESGLWLRVPNVSPCPRRAGVGRAPREPEWEQAPRHHRCAGGAGWSPEKATEALHAENLGLLGVQPQEQGEQRRCLSRRPQGSPGWAAGRRGRSCGCQPSPHDLRGPSTAP